MKSLVCFGLAIFVVVVYSDSNCPTSNKWFRFRNKCFLVEESKEYSLEENLLFCQSLNATSVSIHSKEENNFLKTKLNGFKSYWLGIRQVDYESDTYAWLDNSFYNYSNWNDRKGRKSCAGAYIKSGAWNDDTNCEDTNYALCQIDWDNALYKMLLQTNQLTQQMKDANQKLTICFTLIGLIGSIALLLNIIMCILYIVRRRNANAIASDS